LFFHCAKLWNGRRKSKFFGRFFSPSIFLINQIEFPIRVIHFKVFFYLMQR
jgi:hypothetical protein